MPVTYSFDIIRYPVFTALISSMLSILELNSICLHFKSVNFYFIQSLRSKYFLFKTLHFFHPWNSWNVLANETKRKNIHMKEQRTFNQKKNTEDEKFVTDEVFFFSIKWKTSIQIHKRKREKKEMEKKFEGSRPMSRLPDLSQR